MSGERKHQTGRQNNMEQQICHMLIFPSYNLKNESILQGKYFQDSNTRQLVFKTEELIAWLTQFFTLLPGDVILTGTPPGVGVFMRPPQFLKVC